MRPDGVERRQRGGDDLPWVRPVRNEHWRVPGPPGRRRFKNAGVLPANVGHTAVAKVDAVRRPAGILLTTVAVLVCVARAVWTWWSSQSVDSVAIGATGAGVVLLVLWTLRFTPDWVKLAADPYSERLLAALEEL